MRITKMIVILILFTILVQIASADLPEGWYEVSGKATGMGLRPLLAAEDYVVDSIVHCDFKPRCHCLFQKQE